jgi:methylmalonyl-CoA/ethylmalonyl-CoA epimerase
MQERYRLHHIGVLVRDIPAKAAELVARFGYVIESEVVEDPRQTALVQFLRLPGAEGWLELVSPAGPSSVLRSALDRRAGATHHICYEVDDIAVACQQLRGQAMALVAPAVPAAAFAGRKIAWLIDRDHLLVELVERGPGPLSLPSQPLVAQRVEKP